MMYDNENSNSNSNSNSINTRSSVERKSCLKRILQQTLALHDLVNDFTVNKLDEAVSKADDVTNETSIQEKICNQQEVLIDSQMMTTSSKVLKTCTISLTKRMRDYNYTEFTKKLVRHLQEISDESQSPNWSLLETRITKVFKRIPDYNTVLGTLQPLEKKVIIRKKSEQRLAQQAIMIMPDKITRQANTKDEDSVEQTVRKIRKLIASHCKKTHKPLDIFQLILHPHDFGKTIRNLLYISFLVKDGVVKLRKDNNGSLVVEPCRREVNSQERLSDGRTGIQNIISLNMKQWTTLKETYRLKQPMIDFDEDK